jgi:hypothetical protein
VFISPSEVQLLLALYLMLNLLALTALLVADALVMRSGGWPEALLHRSDCGS